MEAIMRLVQNNIDVNIWRQNVVASQILNYPWRLEDDQWSKLIGELSFYQRKSSFPLLLNNIMNIYQEIPQSHYPIFGLEIVWARNRS